MYSAITDDPKYLEARSRSPLQRNWAWMPLLKNAVHVVRDPINDDHELCGIHERVVADDSILPKLDPETLKKQERIATPHPVQATNGPELLKELGFVEVSEGEVIWLST